MPILPKPFIAILLLCASLAQAQTDTLLFRAGVSQNIKNANATPNWKSAQQPLAKFVW